MLREPTDAERVEFAPVVGELLQALLSGLDRSANGIEDRLVTDAASCLRPIYGKNTLAVGKSYDEWAKRLKLEKTASVRTAFKRLADTALKLGSAGEAQPSTATTSASAEKALRASFSRVESTASGRTVHGTLTVVRPGGQKEGAAGFEVTVTLDGEDIGERTEDGALKKRETKTTVEQREALEKVTASLIRSTSFCTAIAALKPKTLTRRKYPLYEVGQLAVVLHVRRPPALRRVAKLLLFVLLAGSPLAFPEVRAAIAEGVAAIQKFVTGAGHRPAPRPTPTPTPLLAPAPTPAARILVSPPPTVAIPGLTLPMTKDSRGDLPVAGYLDQPLSHMPFLSFASSATCTRCVSLIAYPALTDPRPLRFRVEFGDGKTTTLETVAAVAPGTFDLGRSGLFHLSTPPWYANALFAVTPHEYPDADDTYLVHVIVEAIEPGGATETLVILERLLRIEARGVVSTEVTITVPTPAPDTP